MAKDYKRDFFAEAHQKLKAQGYKYYIERLLPGGSWKNSEWVVKNPTRNDQKPGSFLINGNTGRWKDFAIGKGGNDLISLTSYIKNLTPVEACFYIGVERPDNKGGKNA